MSDENDLIGKKFMYLGLEYEIIYINEQKKRLNIKPVDEQQKYPNIGQRIEIEKIPFKVLYIHNGKKSITMEPFVPDDFFKNNEKEIEINESK